MTADFLFELGRDMAGANLLLFFARASFLMMLAWCTTLLFRTAGAATRHMVWTTSFCCLLLLPVAGRFAPSWAILPSWLATLTEAPIYPRLSPPQFVETPKTTPSDPTTTATDLSEVRNLNDVGSVLPAVRPPSTRRLQSPWRALLGLWALISAAILLFLVAGLLRVSVLGRRARRVRGGDWIELRDEVARQLGLRSAPTLLVSDEAPMPLTWGIARPRVLLPIQAEVWTKSRLRNVLLHEMAHLKRGDPVALLICEVACAIHWFNPIVWLAASRMRMEREHACDDLVLAGGSSPAQYARDLLEVVTSLRTSGFTPGAIRMARPSQLGERLLAVLDPGRHRGGVSLCRRVSTLIIGLGVGVGTVAAAPALPPAEIASAKAEGARWTSADQPDMTRLDLVDSSPVSNPPDDVPLIGNELRTVLESLPEYFEPSAGMSLVSYPHLVAPLGPAAPTLGLISTSGGGVAAPTPGRAPMSSAHSIRGIVVEDESGVPILTAEVTLLDTSDAVVGRYVTDGDGRFIARLPTVGSYRLRARRIGYEPSVSDAFVMGPGQAAMAELRLQVDPLLLDEVEAVVDAQSLALVRDGFYDRQRMGFGHFLTPQDFETKPGLTSLQDLFRDIPGVVALPERPSSRDLLRGMNGTQGNPAGSGRWDLFTRGRSCRPSVSVDGVVVQVGGSGRPSSWNESLSPLSVAAMEVYPSAAGLPEWLAGSGGCGAVVIWTKAHLGQTGRN